MSGSRASVRKHGFTQVTEVSPDGPGRFAGEISSEWTFGGRANGGYLLAMLGRAAAATSAHSHVITASAQYLRSPGPGAVAIVAEVLRAGRTASQVRARMIQDGQPCVEALLTVAELGKASAPYWEAGAPAPGQVDYEDCVRLAPRAPAGASVSLMNQIDVRLEPDSAGFLTRQPSGRGQLRGWLGLSGVEAFDANSLLFAVDTFPPATFDIEWAGWVPTLELTAYIRALPAPGPVRVLQRAHVIDAQRVDEACFVWDRTGRLVAQATQLAGIRLG